VSQQTPVSLVHSKSSFRITGQVECVIKRITVTSRCWPIPISVVPKASVLNEEITTYDLNENVTQVEQHRTRMVTVKFVEFAMLYSFCFIYAALHVENLKRYLHIHKEHITLLTASNSVCSLPTVMVFMSNLRRNTPMWMHIHNHVYMRVKECACAHEMGFLLELSSVNQERRTQSW
jgi:hypothetical protein